jgi:hypothetical protein
MGCRRKVLSGVGVGGKDIVAGWLVSNTCRSMHELVLITSPM